MRKLASLLAGLLLFALTTIGQTRSISGIIQDEKGEPLPGSTVKIKGRNAGTSSNADGRFILVAKTGDVLIISGIGLETTEVTVGIDNSITVSAKRRATEGVEVVVTALGIRRQKNTLPYAAQSVSGDEVSKLRGGNLASALSGKVSGLQVIQGNGIGGSTNVVIRGTKSLTSNNQALFVVDGVPIDNSSGGDVSNTSPMAVTQRTGRGGYDYGNAAADINPDDVESVNVLKGAAATALYGSRAANGVIMITTKKGRKGLGITANTGVIVGRIDKTTFPTYQKEYGAGYSGAYQKDGFNYFDVNGDGVKDLVVPTGEDASYGAKYDPNLLVYQWDAFDPTSPNYLKARPWVAAENDPSSFYETAVSTNNSVMLDGKNDKGSFKLGYTRNDEKGVLPNSRVIKNIVNFGASFNVTDKLTASAMVNYSKIDGKGRYGTGYSGRNVNQNFRQWYQTNVDIKAQKEAYFRTRKNVSWNWSDPSSPTGLVAKYTDNYYWMVYENYETDTRSRAVGNASLNYQFNSWLSLLARISVDNYTELQEERVAVGSKAVPSYARFDKTYNETNYDLMANVDKQLNSDFNFKSVLGVNMRRNTLKSIYTTTAGGLIAPGLYSIANSVAAAPAAVEAYQPKAVDGYFAGVTFGYQGFLTLDGTIRRDRSSTLPVNSNAYNYYSVSGSWVFSKQLPTIAWISSGKIRLNYATVGNDAPWGSLKDPYDQPQPFDNGILFSMPGTKNNETLKPENTTSREAGIEMSFLKNRIGFDFTYYKTNTVNQIIPVALSTATGYTSKYVNAGDVENKGIEVSVYATPVRTNNFSWTINVNWTRNRNKVVALYDNSTNLQLGSFQGGVSLNATLGQPYGTIQGKTWDMLNGQRLVLPTGYYSVTSTTTNVIGNINPDWIGGINNSLKYKNISLSFLVDMRQGGTVWSLDQFYAQYTGVLPESAGLNDLGKPVRNSLANGGGIILPGVTADGKENTKRVVIDANTPKFPASTYSYDASYVKLREVALSYELPQSLFTNIKVIKAVQVSLLGRNLWIIHKNLPYADPEENLSSGNIQGYQSGAYPTTRSLGFNVKITL